MLVVSGTMKPRTSSFGSTKKIISALSPWKRVVTSRKSSPDSAMVWRNSNPTFKKMDMKLCGTNISVTSLPAHPTLVSLYLLVRSVLKCIKRFGPYLWTLLNQYFRNRYPRWCPLQTRQPFKTRSIRWNFDQAQTPKERNWWCWYRCRRWCKYFNIFWNKGCSPFLWTLVRHHFIGQWLFFKVFDISNADRLGFSEVQLIQMVIDGVQFLVKMEKKLEAGEKIEGECDRLQQK